MRAGSLRAGSRSSRRCRAAIASRCCRDGAACQWSSTHGDWSVECAAAAAVFSDLIVKSRLDPLLHRCPQFLESLLHRIDHIILELPIEIECSPALRVQLDIVRLYFPVQYCADSAYSLLECEVSAAAIHTGRKSREIFRAVLNTNKGSAHQRDQEIGQGSKDQLPVPGCVQFSNFLLLHSEIV